MKDINPLQSNALNYLTGVVIFSLDARYRYTAFTASHQEVMKAIWGVEITLGENLLEYIQREDDRKKAQANFDEALRGETFVLEEEYGDESGHVRSWWQDRYSPVYDQDNHIIGLTIFVIEITARRRIEQALRTNELNYRSIMDQAADGIFIADQNGRYLDVNRAGCEMLGYTREEIIGMAIRDLVVATAASPLWLDELRTNRSLITERNLKGRDGKLIPVGINGKVMEDGRFIGVVRGIAERKQAEARIRYLAFVLNNISSAVIATDMGLKITHWNKGAELLYGWREEEVLGRLIDEVCGTKFNDGEQATARQILVSEGKWRGELKQYHRSGRGIWVDASVVLLEDEQGTHIGGVTINHDVTERKAAEHELHRTKNAIEQINLTLQRAFERVQLSARTDSLTAVYNRRYFFELLGYEFAASGRYGRPLAIVMFDVDHLKRVNDTHGYQAGDMILKKAVPLVHRELRQTDVLARYGGDEFVILLPNNEHESFAVFDRIIREVRQAYVMVDGEKLHITISAGIASLQPGMDKPEDLVLQADQALYSARNQGRNRMVVFHNRSE